MDKRNPLAHRDAAEELAALINMTRFMADAVHRVAPNPERVQEHLTRLEAELQTQLQHADGASGLARRAN
jgi:hypothetical protein